MVVLNRKNSMLWKGGQGGGILVFMGIFCFMIDLYARNIKYIKFEYDLVKNILKNYIKNEKKNSILNTNINSIHMKQMVTSFTLNCWNLMYLESRNIS